MKSKREPTQLRAIRKLLKSSFAPNEKIDAFTIEEVAEALGVTPRTIYNKLEKLEAIKSRKTADKEESLD